MIIIIMIIRMTRLIIIVMMRILEIAMILTITP